jgi:hypothetical protein
LLGLINAACYPGWISGPLDSQAEKLLEAADAVCEGRVGLHEIGFHVERAVLFDG